MARKKTDAEFKAQVRSIVGDEYQVLNPYDGADKKIRFRHQRCGKSFEMKPSSFLEGHRCPKCMSNKRTNKEFRQKVKRIVGNEYLILDNYVNSQTKIRFKHQKCGFVFFMRPNSFLQGTRCPKCMCKKQHLRCRKTDARFREEVKLLVGNEYAVLEEYINGHTKIEFKHQKCETIFAMTPDSFLQGTRCPKCMQRQAHKKHKRTNKEFQVSVKRTTGKEYLILDRYSGYKIKIRFRHQKCGTIFAMTPDSFLRGHRCPQCMRKKSDFKKRKTNYEFKREVESLTGKSYLILGKYKGANKKIEFKHQICGNAFLMSPSHFLKGNRCPYCKCSNGEKIVRKYLEKHNIHFKYQFKIADCRDQMPLPFDFAIFNENGFLNCLIEYQGAQHFYNPFVSHNHWFSQEAVLKTQKHDAMKLQYCKDHGIKLIRINHPQTSSKSNSIEFIERLVNRTLNKELHVV